MRIGCQVGLWGRNLKDAMSDISAVGLEGIETFGLEEYYDKPERFHALLDKFGLTLSGIYHNDNFITPELQPQTLQKATAIIKFLKVVGGEFIVLHSGGVKKKEGYPISVYDQLTNTMNQIGKIGYKYGIKVACHPHMGTMVENREELTILMERLNPDLVGLCPHAAHWLRVGVDPYEIYRTYANRVSYVHVSDQEVDGKGVHVGEGKINQRALMKPLQTAGFDGWVIIEGRNEDVPVKESIKISAQYLRKEFIGK